MMASNPKQFQTTSGVALSLPEVDALCQRAARGAGLSWGMAEECGVAACWLAQHEQPWAEIILGCLQDPASRDIRPAADMWIGDQALCGLHAGVTFAEFAGLPEGPTANGISLGTIRDARLLLPFVARAAGQRDMTLEIIVAGHVWAAIDAENCALAPKNITDQPIIVRMAPMAIQKQGSALQRTAWASNGQKNTLDQLALHATVPSSAQSESRAGGDEPDSD